MALFTAYDPNGNIASIITAADLTTAQGQVPSTYTVLSGSHPATWNNAGSATALGTMTPTVTGATISGLPSPCTIILLGQPPNIVVGGSFTLSGTSGTTYRVLLRASHYNDLAVNVTIP